MTDTLRCYICNRDIPWDLAVYDASPRRHDRAAGSSPSSARKGARRNTSSGGASFARKLFQQPLKPSGGGGRRNTYDPVDESPVSIQKPWMTLGKTTNSYCRGVTVDDCITSATDLHGDDDGSAKLLLLLCDVPLQLTIDRNGCCTNERDQRHSVAAKLCRILSFSPDSPDWQQQPGVANSHRGRPRGLYYCDTLVNQTPSNLQTTDTLSYLTWSFLLDNETTNRSRNSDSSELGKTSGSYDRHSSHRERTLLYTRDDDMSSMINVLNGKVLDTHTCEPVDYCDVDGSRSTRQQRRVIVRAYVADSHQYVKLVDPVSAAAAAAAAESQVATVAGCRGGGRASSLRRVVDRDPLNTQLRTTAIGEFVLLDAQVAGDDALSPTSPQQPLQAVTVDCETVRCTAVDAWLQRTPTLNPRWIARTLDSGANHSTPETAMLLREAPRFLRLDGHGVFDGCKRYDDVEYNGCALGHECPWHRWAKETELCLRVLLMHHGSSETREYIRERAAAANNDTTSSSSSFFPLFSCGVYCVDVSVVVTRGSGSDGAKSRRFARCALAIGLTRLLVFPLTSDEDIPTIPKITNSNGCCKENDESGERVEYRGGDGGGGNGHLCGMLRRRKRSFTGARGDNRTEDATPFTVDFESFVSCAMTNRRRRMPNNKHTAYDGDVVRERYVVRVFARSTSAMTQTLYMSVVPPFRVADSRYDVRALNATLCENISLAYLNSRHS